MHFADEIIRTLVKIVREETALPLYPLCIIGYHIDVMFLNLDELSEN